jgi:hypothetical protein
MSGRIEKPELVALVAQRTNQDPALVETIVDGVIEEIYTVAPASAPPTQGRARAPDAR